MKNLRKASALFFAGIMSFCNLNSQSVSGIITDFNLYWKSSSASPNAIKPNNSHNLLAFTYNGIQYSTGANDLLLTSRGESFIAGDFWSLPVDIISALPTANTKVGIGEMKDGVHAAAGLLPPSLGLAAYLTDGIKGLDLGTCIANLPAGTINFWVNAINPSKIGDGVPDIIVTQIADPSGSTDSYSFVNGNGGVVGHKKDIVFTSITPVGTWTADFYEASVTPRLLTTGFTNTDRPLRLWAADLSEFGITNLNYQDISKFSIRLSGNSDVAFAAYNNKTFSISSLLPVTLIDFSARPAGNRIQLQWKTAQEENLRCFVIERSADNNRFHAIDTMAAAGGSQVQQYAITDEEPRTGTNYYRLKSVNTDGSYSYGKVIAVHYAKTSLKHRIYPNPSRGQVTMTHPAATDAFIVVVDVSGTTAGTFPVTKNAPQTVLPVQHLPKGCYYACWQNSTDRIFLPFVLQ